MPRKKRKNRSSQQGRAPQKRRTETKGLNTTGFAPAPIRMKYFEASIDGLSGTFEERLTAIREIGRVAAEKFPKQYRSIQEWFKKYDQPKLLSFCFYFGPQNSMFKSIIKLTMTNAKNIENSY